MTMTLALFLLLTFSLLNHHLQASPFGCLNGKGDFVDWWVIYKISNSENYLYMDSTRLDQGPLGISESRILSSRHGPLSRTIKSTGFPTLRSARHDPIFLSWNDQPPYPGHNPIKAHAKVNETFSYILFFKIFILGFHGASKHFSRIS